FINREDDVGDVGERRPDGDGLPRPQTLAAGVGTRLRGAVRVDDLSPAPGPGPPERAWEGFASRHDVAANRIGEVHFGSSCEGGEQDGRTEQYRDLSFAQDADEVRAGPDLIFGQHDHG